MDKVKKVPELRFKEFEGDWVVKKLGTLIKERSEFANEETPLYSLTIENGIVQKNERYEREFLVKDLENAYKVMRKYDFAYNPMNLRFGALALYKDDDEIKVSKYYNIFFLENIEQSRFFEYYLTSYNLIHFYNKMAVGSLDEKKRVHFSDFINFKRLLPNEEEQKKIAEFLSQVDKKIEQLTKKKHLLESYKKGAMQKIFSQELRFKDDKGEDYPDWELSELIDLVKKSSSKYDPEKEDKIYECVELESLSQENGILLKTFNSKELKSIKNKFVTGDILFGKLRPYLKKFLRTSFDGVCSSEIWVLNGIRIINDFLYYLIQTNKFNYIANISSGSKMPRADWEYISSTPFFYPNKCEQQKIANFLTEIDNKIKHVTKQLEGTKQFKKGLLQKMFV